MFKGAVRGLADWRNKANQEPQLASTSVYLVVRGGSWDCKAVDYQSASRNGGIPSSRGPDIGFRLVG